MASVMGESVAVDGGAASTVRRIASSPVSVVLSAAATVS
jgi:hypothetical protein